MVLGPEDFKAGDEVVLKGLSKAELNGQLGTILPLFDPDQAKRTGRVAVMLRGGQQMSIKALNLVHHKPDLKPTGGDKGPEWSQTLNEKGKNVTVKLRGGGEMPLLGFGTHFIPEDLKDYIPDKMYRTKMEAATVGGVTAAIDAGIRCFDCCNDHVNQRAVGKALAAAIEDEEVTREELFIIVRITHAKTREQVQAEFQMALNELQIEYADLLMPSIPVSQRKHEHDELDMFKMDSGRGTALEAWPWLEEIHDSGKAKHLGVCNFDTVGKGTCVEVFRELLQKARICPAVHQMEVHPFQINSEMLSVCDSADIIVQAISPLACPNKIEAFFGIMTKSDARELRPVLNSLNNPLLEAIGEKHGVSNAQVVLRWHLQRGCAVVPKSYDPEHVAENANLFHFSLSRSEIVDICALHSDMRGARFYAQVGRNGGKALPLMNRDANDKVDEILKKHRTPEIQAEQEKQQQARLEQQMAQMQRQQEIDGVDYGAGPQRAGGGYPGMGGMGGMEEMGGMGGMGGMRGMGGMGGMGGKGGMGGREQNMQAGPGMVPGADFGI